MLHAVIMAGGSGTRFWPMSRRNRPKHLLNLTGSASLLQQTVNRVASWIPAERTLVITGVDHVSAVRAQVPHLPAECVIAEPCRRDTAPCIALAAELVLRGDPSATMVVMPADHVIEPEIGFRRTVELAVQLVAEDSRRLVTVGIKPDRPATGYGYIQRGNRLPRSEALAAFDVRQFREKPNYETALEFLRSGEFYWNSGVFVWLARTILDEIQAARPVLYDSIRTIARHWDTTQRQDQFKLEYSRIEPISIDYAVLERSSRVVTVEADFQWDDVGSWGALERLEAKEAASNTVHGLHRGIDTRHCIVLSDPDHLVATVGIEDLIIVQCGKATLVANKRHEESVKRLVELLQQQGLDGFL